MIRSIFTRDKPGTTDPAIAEFLADEELKFGDQVPTGTYLDMTSKLPLVDPKKVLGPVHLSSSVPIHTPSSPTSTISSRRVGRFLPT